MQKLHSQTKQSHLRTKQDVEVFGNNEPLEESLEWSGVYDYSTLPDDVCPVFPNLPRPKTLAELDIVERLLDCYVGRIQQQRDVALIAPLRSTVVKPN